MFDLVSVQGVSKSFPGMEKPALSHISCTMQSGMFTGIVGPDGAGKTTLMRLMAGLLMPQTGHISILGLDSIRDEKQLRPQIGYMPQRFGLYGDLTVEENLNLYADLRGVESDHREEVFESLLRFTTLQDFKNRLADKLSGGMKQKLGLACALLKEPKLLLLDEPSVGVDPISRRELWSMVNVLVERGMGVIWSTAYLDEAEKCEKVILINDGLMLFDGKPCEIMSEVKGRTFHILGIADHKRDVLTQALEIEGVMDGLIQGDNIRILTETGNIPKKLEAIVLDHHAKIIPTPANFEDAFINRLGGAGGGTSRLAQSIKPIVLNQEIVIESRDLTKKFGDFTAADHVNFSIKQGEIFGFLGPNGAGKSTTFKMLCGLLKPTYGDAKINGLDLKHQSSHARESIGYMAQKFSLYGNLSVLQNLKFFSGVYALRGSERKSAVDEMIDLFSLESKLNINTDDLSLGFKQRLALACALMHRPIVLFLDEPTSGVDPITRREFWTHINGLVHKGMTIMISTHFMDEAEYCDRVALIYRGKKIAEGSPDDLKKMAVHTDLQHPTMEDAFIELIQQHDNGGRSP